MPANSRWDLIWVLKGYSTSEQSFCDWMQRSQHRSHCWNHCLNSSKMLSRAASDSRWTSATSSKRLPGNKKWSQRARSGEGGGHIHHFVFSQNGGVLLTLQRFKENRWRPLTAFPLKILDRICSSVSGAGIAASSHRGNALRATKVTNL